MENGYYTTLNRQIGLLRDAQTVAQNIANISTTGYRAERIEFSEFVNNLGPDEPSLSMADGAARATDLTQGELRQTNGTFDLAIEGEGFFLVGTPDGDRLTRAGAFSLSSEGSLTSPDGALLLDAGGAPVFVPPNATAISVGPDGTVSADGEPVAQLGLWTANSLRMTREDGVRFNPNGPPELIDGGRILQGFVERSNVDAVTQMAKLIQTQRAYELGQSFLDREDERVSTAIRLIGQ